MSANRLQNNIADVLLPRNVKGAVRSALLALLDELKATHGNPDLYDRERIALGKLAVMSEFLFNGDLNHLPMALRRFLAEKDLALYASID